LSSNGGNLGEPDRLIIVTIESEPAVRLINSTSTRVNIGGRVFDETGSGDTNGFYDFLRSHRNEIVGIRFVPFLTCDFLLDAARASPWLRITGTPPFAAIEIIWNVDSRFEDDCSGDQLSSGNYLFRSHAGINAVTFDVSALSSEERSQLVARFGVSGSAP
jgi:hypothetical protein